MEEEKKKFLLSKIKREESLITAQFQKFKQIYQAKEISREKKEAFLEHITHTIQINTSLASNLYEYLEKNQIEAIFNRINLVFSDLIDKYRKCCNKLTYLQSSQNIKEIRQICDVCHDKIESNRIQNIRRGLDEQSQCRAAVIKKLIEDSELERTTPVFTEDEDREFKRQLQKVFQSKEMVLQTNIHESNVFLTAVQEEIAEFMVSFRRDFAQWGGHQIQEQNQNWGKMMKGYINKKLTNSFNSKIPSWIKKMKDIFCDRQTAKPKTFYTNKDCQVNFPTQNQESVLKQMQELNHSMIMKREALKDKERQLENEKIRSKALKSQLDSIQQYYVEKLYAFNKEDSKEKGLPQIQESFTIDNIRHTTNQLSEKQSEMNDLNERDRQINSKRNKKKFVKMPYQMLQKSPKQLKSSDNLSYSQHVGLGQSTMDLNSQKSTDLRHIRKETTQTISSVDRSSIQNGLPQGLKLKKKAYNRQRRDEMVNDYEKDRNNQSISYLTNKQLEKEELRDEVKLICNEISKDLPFKKLAKNKNQNRRFNSISMTDDIPQMQSNHAKSPSQIILPISQKIDTMQVAIPDAKHHIGNEILPHQQINSSEMNQAVSKILALSKYQQVVTEHDKKRLNKVIQNFLNTLQRRNSNSISYQPVRLSKVQFSTANKQNVPLSSHREEESPYANKSLKKDKSKYHETNQRKNRSLQTNILKLPAISIKNYNYQQNQDLSSLSKDHLPLYIDEASALQFQQSFSQNQEKAITKPTPSQLQEIEKMYSELQGLKRRNNANYAQFCMFFRYPYTSLKERSVTVSQGSSINFPTFCNYFLKILWIHRNCPKQQTNPFCLHIERFKRKLSSLNPDRKNNYKLKRSDRIDFMK